MFLCNIFGHLSDPDLYARKDPTYSERDGIGRVHVRIQAQCVRCDEYFQICKLHWPNKEEVK